MVLSLCWEQTREAKGKLSGSGQGGEKGMDSGSVSKMEPTGRAERGGECRVITSWPEQVE